jgi:hypothetical protein
LAAADSWAAFKFRSALQAVSWLRDSLQLINTYNDPPKSLEELQQDAQNPHQATIYITLLSGHLQGKTDFQTAPSTGPKT